MLGWKLYLEKAFSAGTERLSQSWFIICVFSFIFKFETTFLKKVFNSLAIVWLTCNNPLPSASCIFEPLSP